MTHHEQIILGTAAVGKLHTSGAIRKFLASCLQAGITQFDTAPLYGSGLMEKFLGEALRNHENQAKILVNTKFGLSPRISSSLLDRSYFLKKSALALAARLNFTQKKAYSEITPLEMAKQSLQRSLTHFGKGKIDVFFAHEVPTARMDSPEFLSFIQKAKQEGWIQKFGLGGYRAQYGTGGSSAFWNMVDVVQVESVPGELFQKYPGWGGEVFLHGVISAARNHGVVNLHAALAEAHDVQGADRIVLGISQVKHLDWL